MQEPPTPRRPLRVAHLMQYFEIGGLERMVERLTVASRPHGVESLVIAYLGDGPVRNALEAEGVRTLLLGGGPGLQPGLVWRLRSVLKRERIDVLHTHHLGPFIYGAPAALLAGCRRVHTEHSHEQYDTRRRRLLGSAMSPLSEVVAVSPEVSAYRKRFPGRCQVIPNGVPLPAPDAAARARGREMLGANETSFVVGCAARLSEEKDHTGLLEAFAILLEDVPRAILACAGDGPLRDELARRARTAGLEEHVRWLGAVDDMQSFYSALDVCVLNSTREGLPLCLLEAMSFGVPVVATNVGGVGDLLAGGAGLLVPARAPAVLAASIRSVATQANWAQNLAQSGRARVREGYSIDQMTDRYVALYRRVAKRSAPPPGMESVPCV